MLNTVSKGIIRFFTVILWIGTYIGGIALHLWTVYAIFLGNGLIGGVMAFFFPVISELYLMYVYFKITGDFFIIYNVAVMAYFLVVIVRAIFTILFCKTEEQYGEQIDV